MVEVKCPTCDGKVIWSTEAKYRPFCSHRCRLIDLGKWADGSHHIPGEAAPSNEESQLPQDY